jgi:hypothetical protein
MMNTNRSFVHPGASVSGKYIMWLRHWLFYLRESRVVTSTEESGMRIPYDTITARCIRELKHTFNFTHLGRITVCCSILLKLLGVWYAKPPAIVGNLLPCAYVKFYKVHLVIYRHIGKIKDPLAWSDFFLGSRPSHKKNAYTVDQAL